VYWIYLILFTVIVYTPSVVTSGFLGFSTTQSQEFSILVIGCIGFALFIVREKRYQKQMQEKMQYQMQVSRMSKELNHSYSYIGEINRKLDILEHITQGFPETLQLTARKKMEVYDSIMMGIQLFSKADEFVICFMNSQTGEVLKEIRSKAKMRVHFPHDVCVSHGQFVENDDFICTTSPKTIDNVFASIIIRKKKSSHKIEDPEIIKTIAAQSLFLFMFIQKNNHAM
jgi:hypothetical protein